MKQNFCVDINTLTFLSCLRTKKHASHGPALSSADWISSKRQHTQGGFGDQQEAGWENSRAPHVTKAQSPLRLVAETPDAHYCKQTPNMQFGHC